MKLKPNAKARVLAGHPWVFANEVEALPGAENDGGVVECRDRNGRFLGTGIYNSKSQIAWRRLSRDRVELNEAFFRAAITRACAARNGMGDYCRLVWSESDDLPGVVVDRFGDVLVVQFLTLAMDRMAPVIEKLLLECTGAAGLIVRNDAGIRRFEGLPMEVRFAGVVNREPRWVTIDGFDYWLDLENGQKTGFYLDQRSQHSVIEKYCAGGRVLDAFCNQGSFAMHAAKAGAAEVLGLDSAPDAIEQATRNAGKNGVKAGFLVANVFDWFNEPGRSTDAKWDVIVLDPPPFAKSKSAMAGALRGYKELNLRALKLLNPGGVLATYTCSHHMQDAELRQVLAEASADAKRKVQILEFCHQPPDHPVLVTMPESEYLRGYILRVE